MKIIREGAQAGLVGLRDAAREHQDRFNDTELEMEQAEDPWSMSKVHMPTTEECNDHCKHDLFYMN